MQDLHHGKEIYLFFGKYGINGIIGIIISQIIIGIIVYKTLRISKENNIENYADFSKYINRTSKINEITKKIINIFLLLSFYVMIAGFSAYFSQELGIPNIIGTITIIVLCYITFIGNIEGIIKVNTVLIPILIIFIIILATKNMSAFENINNKIVQPNYFKSIYSAIIYSSYNSITLIPIVITLKKYMKNKNQIKLVSILVIITLIVLAISIYILTLKVDIDINKLELPTVYVAGMSGKIYKLIYGGIILVAIFTSSISAGYSILENYIDNPKKYKKIAIIMCASGILVSKIGFSTLINILYPMFGILGIIQIIFLMKNKSH